MRYYPLSHSRHNAGYRSRKVGHEINTFTSPAIEPSTCPLTWWVANAVMISSTNTPLTWAFLASTDARLHYRSICCAFDNNAEVIIISWMVIWKAWMYGQSAITGSHRTLSTCALFDLHFSDLSHSTSSLSWHPVLSAFSSLTHLAGISHMIWLVSN